MLGLPEIPSRPNGSDRVASDYISRPPANANELDTVARGPRRMSTGALDQNSMRHDREPVEIRPRERQLYYSAYSQAETVSNTSHHMYMPPVELPAKLPEIELPTANENRQEEEITQSRSRSARPRERSVDIRIKSSHRQPTSREGPQTEETTENRQYIMVTPQARDQRNPRYPATRNVIRKRTGSRDEGDDGSRVRSRSRAARQRAVNDREERPYPAEPDTSASRTTNQQKAFDLVSGISRRPKGPPVQAANAASSESYNRRREPVLPSHTSDKRTTRPSHASVQRQQRGVDSRSYHFPPARHFASSGASSVSTGQDGNAVSSVTSTSDEREKTPQSRSLRVSMRHMASVIFNDDDRSLGSEVSSLGRRR
jgi:hypothetical protein